MANIHAVLHSVKLTTRTWGRWCPIRLAGFQPSTHIPHLQGCLLSSSSALCRVAVDWSSSFGALSAPECFGLTSPLSWNKCARWLGDAEMANPAVSFAQHTKTLHLSQQIRQQARSEGVLGNWRPPKPSKKVRFLEVVKSWYGYVGIQEQDGAEKRLEARFYTPHF